MAAPRDFPSASQSPKRVTCAPDGSTDRICAIRWRRKQNRPFASGIRNPRNLFYKTLLSQKNTNHTSLHHQCSKLPKKMNTHHWATHKGRGEGGGGGFTSRWGLSTKSWGCSAAKATTAARPGAPGDLVPPPPLVGGIR